MMLKAGTASIDISPKPGVQLAGYPHCPRYNKGVHDPIYASCLYLNNGESEVVLVTMDIHYLGKPHVKTLREKFGKHIMFSSSHTHSGPWGVTQLHEAELEEGIRIDSEYTAELLEKLEKIISESINNQFDATIGTYIGRCGAEQGVGGNRREKGGVCDPSVSVLAVKDSAGDIRTCLVNYALHPTYLHADNEFVSADFPGFIRRFFHFAFPKAVCMFGQGTSGDQSSRYHRIGQNFEEAVRVGTTIGVEAFHCVEKMTFTDDIKLGNQWTEIEFPMKSYPPLDEAKEAVRLAKEKFESLKDGDYLEARNAELAMFGAESVYNYAIEISHGYTCEDLPCEIQFLTIGDTLIVGFQGEAFVEYGLRIKEMSPAEKTFVFTLTNGTLPGYMYTQEAIDEGGYEVGNSMLADNAGNILMEKIEEMMKEL